FASLSRRGPKFCDAHVITFNEAVEIYPVPFGGNVFDIRGLGVVWLCVSGSSHTSCSEHDIKNSGVCYCRLALPSAGKNRQINLSKSHPLSNNWTCLLLNLPRIQLRPPR